MKMQITLVLSGKDTFEEKFKKIVENTPEIHLNLVRAMVTPIMLAFNLNESDEISIDGFKFTKVIDPVPDSLPVASSIEKIVEY